jgi:hypothetical protein
MPSAESGCGVRRAGVRSGVQGPECRVRRSAKCGVQGATHNTRAAMFRFSEASPIETGRLARQQRRTGYATTISVLGTRHRTRAPRSTQSDFGLLTSDSAHPLSES